MARVKPRRQAPPKPGSKKTSTSKKAEEAEEAEEADDKGKADDKPSGGKGGKGSTTGLPAHIRKASTLRRFADRLQVSVHGKGPGQGERTTTEMDGWIENEKLGQARALADNAVSCLSQAAEILEGLGLGFDPLPPKSRRGKVGLAITKGCTVKLKDKLQAPEQYGDLADGDLNNLKVIDVRGKKFACETDKGEKLFLTRNQVDFVAPPPE